MSRLRGDFCLFKRVLYSNVDDKHAFVAWLQRLLVRGLPDLRVALPVALDEAVVLEPEYSTMPGARDVLQRWRAGDCLPDFVRIIRSWQQTQCLNRATAVRDPG